MSTITLCKEFVAGMMDYIAKHNANYATIETTLNYLLSLVSGQMAGDYAVPPGLQQIIDRKGVFGRGSYDFSEGTLTGPSYNLTVAAGAYWSGAAFLKAAGATNISMTARATGAYYLTLDASGLPGVSDTPGADTVRQFAWDADTHQVSAKAIYTGIALLFDGDDYADMLTSAARAKNFTKAADRLEEIELLLAKTVQTPASADTVNINWFLGGHVRLTLDRAATALSFAGAYDGQKCVLELIQDEVGGRTVSFGAEVLAGTDFTFPVPLSAANRRDFLGFIYSAENGKYHYTSMARGY